MLPEGTREVLLTEAQIAARIQELGQLISDDYAGKNLLLIGVLKGSFIFLADLVRNISIPLTIDFVTLSSYGDSTTSSGNVKIIESLRANVSGQHVVVVEDIVDTGWTLSMSRILEDLHSGNAASVKVCTLLDKRCRREVDVPVDYVGFEIEDRFVVGFGMDFDGLFRSLPMIAALDEKTTL